MSVDVDVRIDKGIHGISARWVKNVIARALEFERVGADPRVRPNGRPQGGAPTVSVLLTGDRQIRRLNKKYLNHDYATDVIAFGAGDSGFLGDIVVSVEMAKSVSKELGIPFREELARYLVHGTLHLLGYRDKKPRDKKRMEKKQESILASL